MNETVKLCLAVHIYTGRAINDYNPFHLEENSLGGKVQKFREIMSFAVALFEPLGSGYEISIVEIYFGYAERMKGGQKFNLAIEFYGNHKTSRY